jgi:hypothetical protein
VKRVTAANLADPFNEALKSVEYISETDSMAEIHFVERKNNVARVPNTADEWESGFWVVAESTAQQLIGGDLYLHSGQTKPSHFGGKILSYRVHREGSGSEIDGRLVFRIKSSAVHKGVLTGREGWGNEKKIVW